MTSLLTILFVVAAMAALTFGLMWYFERESSDRQEEEARAKIAAAEHATRTTRAQLTKAAAEIRRLSKWSVVADADEKAQEIRAAAELDRTQAKEEARVLLTDAERRANDIFQNARREADQAIAQAAQEVKRATDEARTIVTTANLRANEVLVAANQKAISIAGKAFDAVRNAETYEQTARAMKNLINGYGDEYLVPAASVLDELAEEFAHKDAGNQLKIARAHTRIVIKEGRGAACDYTDETRQEGAKRFVVDAFIGKTDSILSRVKHDNYGKLEQEIRDAFDVVNFGGKAFREARVTRELLDARLAELKWGAIARELKRIEQEEQRQLREQIREEQKARREYEKAMKEAAREEAVLREAMADAQAKIAAATKEQRAFFEAQLAELNAKLQESEDRNRRAISMAQQTKRGFVYIISNVGSFGEDIYKVGLTRRLDPIDRVKELGDASVPFEFDVHAIISSDDAPALESKLHKHLRLHQVNKVNHRKEFFRAPLAKIRSELDKMGIDAKWTMAAEAREYRETQTIERTIAADPAAREAWLNREWTAEEDDEVYMDDPEVVVV